MPKITAKDVATALARVNPMAGQTCDSETPESVDQRAENLLRDTQYGPYIAKGDPYNWGGGEALFTILLEQKGVKGDCYPPMDYYEGGANHAYEASELLKDAFIEFQNAAVALVWAD